MENLLFIIISAAIAYFIIAFAVKRGVSEALYEFKEDIMKEMEIFREIKNDMAKAEDEDAK